MAQYRKKAIFAATRDPGSPLDKNVLLDERLCRGTLISGDILEGDNGRWEGTEQSLLNTIQRRTATILTPGEHLNTEGNDEDVARTESSTDVNSEYSVHGSAIDPQCDEHERLFAKGIHEVDSDGVLNLELLNNWPTPVGEKNFPCEFHTAHPMEFWCITCEKPLCSRCVYEEVNSLYGATSFDLQQKLEELLQVDEFGEKALGNSNISRRSPRVQATTARDKAFHLHLENLKSPRSRAESPTATNINPRARYLAQLNEISDLLELLFAECARHNTGFNDNNHFNHKILPIVQAFDQHYRQVLEEKKASVALLIEDCEQIKSILYERRNSWIIDITEAANNVDYCMKLECERALLEKKLEALTFFKGTYEAVFRDCEASGELVKDYIDKPASYLKFYAKDQRRNISSTHRSRSNASNSRDNSVVSKAQSTDQESGADSSVLQTPILETPRSDLQTPRSENASTPRQTNELSAQKLVRELKVHSHGVHKINIINFYQKYYDNMINTSKLISESVCEKIAENRQNELDELDKAALLLCGLTDILNYALDPINPVVRIKGAQPGANIPLRGRIIKRRNLKYLIPPSTSKA